jgi:hypothetical protein
MLPDALGYGKSDVSVLPLIVSENPHSPLQSMWQTQQMLT